MPPRNTPERFWAKVERSPDCWLWQGTIDPAGYGTVRYEGRTAKAHRIAYTLATGPIPEGLTLDHLCRVRACVNPSHLEPVTQAENTQRAFRLQTSCRNGHPYDGNLIIDQVSGARRCRICRNGKSADRRRAKRHARGLLYPRGERHGMARLTEADVRHIRSSPLSLDELAQELGVTKTNVSMVRLGRTWRYVT